MCINIILSNGNAGNAEVNWSRSFSRWCLGSGMNCWSYPSSGPRMDFQSQVGISQLSGSFSFLFFWGEEMAYQIATGLKVPGLATVSSIFLEWGGVCHQWHWSLQPAGALLLVVGLIMLTSSLIWGAWARLEPCPYAWLNFPLMLSDNEKLIAFRIHPYELVLIGCTQILYLHMSLVL